jgi:hypothetical protein
MATNVWKPPLGRDNPANIEDFRKLLIEMARKRPNRQLCDVKFIKNHLCTGRPIEDKALNLALRREKEENVKINTCMESTQMYANAEKEVLNWINKLLPTKFNINEREWSLKTEDGAVGAATTYKCYTVYLNAMRKPGNKKRDWLTVSQKAPKVVCWFDTDGTPMIHHMKFN